MVLDFRILLSIGWLGVLGSAGICSATVDFNREVRPILSEHCYHCHGPDEGSRKAKLRLDSHADAIKERDGVRAVVPGDLKNSELILRILSKDDDEIMPPPKEHKPLSKPQIETLKKWVAQGAEYAPHWSFCPIQRPAVPTVSGYTARNPIDAFIRSRLDGLSPSPEADRATLIRRLSLDLTGLPPTPEVTDAFLKDSSPDSYEKAVDRLLGSPAYGERWAKLWLDLGRYADSTGYGQDSLRMNIWPWRDWVINSLNNNKPYDQLTIEQIAGDLLPNATTEQITATAFHRNTMTNTEGGTDDEEYRVAAVKDRVATTMQVWMGLTAGCAQCHTHKFDPISHKEYYQLFAVFNQTQDADRSDESPRLPLPTAFEAQKRAELQQEITALEAKNIEPTPQFEAELKQWENDIKTRGNWTVLAAETLEATGGVTLTKQADGSILASGADPETSTYTLTAKGPLKGITAIRLEALPDASLPKKGPGRSAEGNAVISEVRMTHRPGGPLKARGRFVRVELPGAHKMLALAEVQVFDGSVNLAPKGTASQSSTDFDGHAKLAIDENTEGHYFNGKSVTHTADGDNPWWEVDLGDLKSLDRIVLWNRTDAHVSWLIGAKLQLLDEKRKLVFEKEIQFAPEPSAEFFPATGNPIPLQNPSADFSQMGFDARRAIDGKDNNGWAFSPETGKPHAWAAELVKPLDVAENSGITFAIVQNYAKNTLGRFRVSLTTQPPPVREVPTEIQAILAKERDQRQPAERDQLATYFRSVSKVTSELTKLITEKKAALAKIKPVEVPILKERGASEQRASFLLLKGNFMTPGEKVSAGLPTSFHPVPKGDINRLALARWIMAEDNPLTARVAVNRYWAQIFGTGLVATEEDFGAQGQMPSHPELLDWLAAEFQKPSAPGATPWDVKRLLKLLVMSDTYRQSSKITPAAWQKDPQNRLLSRMSRRRLEAEAVRDQALQLAGLLSSKIGGPSVYPPQPDGTWRVAFNNGENAYPTSTGEDRWRRSIYTIWRRNAPNPTQTLFDAPSRETCVLRRIPTNTPLQAFVTLNDPVFVECAQGLARRLMQEGSIESRLQFGLNLCLGQPGTADQVSTLKGLYETELAHFRANPAEATRLATSSQLPLPKSADPVQLAAWTAVANVLLNLDGVLTNR